MKKRLAILIAAVLSMCFMLVGCGSDDDFINKETAVKVVFNLEGGTYQNSPAPIVYYYAFKKGTENLIKNPAAADESEKFNDSTVKRNDYYLDGWYRTKNVLDDGTVEYEDKWDFAVDRVSDDGVVLYASWIRLIHYYYGVYYIDSEGEEVLLGKYTVDEGVKFNDKLGYADRRTGWTKLGYFSDPECTEPWDEDFTHPGGENDAEIKVYVKYEEGAFVEVWTAAELVKYRFRDIRLMQDIDMNDLTDDEKNSFVDSFKGYSGIIEGNGFAIKNLVMTYGQTEYDLYDGDEIDESGDKRVLGISLFGNGSGARIRNVRFENLTVDINVSYSRIQRVVFAPLFLKPDKVSVTDVSVTGTVVISQSDLNQTLMSNGKLEVVTDRPYFVADSASTFQNVTLDIKLDNKLA